jgi:hypothetical protein
LKKHFKSDVLEFCVSVSQLMMHSNKERTRSQPFFTEM